MQDGAELRRFSPNPYPRGEIAGRRVLGGAAGED